VISHVILAVEGVLVLGLLARAWWDADRKAKAQDAERRLQDCTVCGHCFSDGSYCTRASGHAGGP